MKRIALILTLLVVAGPALATVTITTEIDDVNDRKIWIAYTSDEAELIRAFALDITVEDGNILAVEDYAVGDDNGGYGIFPGTFSGNIQVDPQTGAVVNWDVAGYSPVAPSDDPNALGGIGTSGVTIEMGSLYDTAAPNMTDGILCSVTVDENVTMLCVKGNGTRGSVILENGSEPEVIYPDCYGEHPCPGPSHPHYTMWVKLGKPGCWCGKSVGSGYQCDGDADGKDSGMPFKYRVYMGDLSILVANWKKKAGNVDLDPCADFDHKDSGMPFKYQVYMADLTILVNNWKKKDTGINALAGDCPR